MSARDELYDAAVSDNICDCYPGGADEVNARINAYRDEVLREAAARIRTVQGHLEGGEWLDNAGGMLSAADLIDPDVEQLR